MSEKNEQKKVKKGEKAKVGNVKRKKTIKAIIAVIALIVLITVGIVLIININKEKGGAEGMAQNENIVSAEKNVSIAEDGTKVNISSKIKEEKELDGLKIVDMEITEVDNVSTIVANVKNETKEEKGEYAIEIKLIDKEGNEIARVPGYIGKIPAGGNMALTASATYNFVDAYNCEIEKK